MILLLFVVNFTQNRYSLPDASPVTTWLMREPEIVGLPDRICDAPL